MCIKHCINCIVRKFVKIVVIVNYIIFIIKIDTYPYMDDSLILFALGFILIVLGLFVKTYFACSKGSSPSEKPVPVLTQKKLSPLKKPKSQYIGEILIFFGSQSGTAAKYSNILAEEAETNDFEAKVVDLEEYESHKFKEKLCVFLMATYGEGDPTDNAKAFYKWLKSEAMDKETLKGLKFVVFGLGNSQYQHYNAMGRNVNKLLEDLGGERYIIISLHLSELFV